MITKSTVLILGAGASNHLGYPIGIQLINDICNDKNISKFKIINQNEISEDHIEDFIKYLRHAQYYSIDAFLEENIDFVEIGKLLITFILKKHEVESLLFAPNSPGWYQYLFNSIIDGSIDNIEKNKISIITYNYDRSLEYYLHQSFIHRYRISEQKALDILNKLTIIHLHGILGQYPKFPYQIDNDFMKLKEISKEIKIISELDDKSNEFCSEEYHKSFEILYNSENIYFLGFGFHNSNLKRFNFFTSDNTKNKNIRATLSGMGPIEIGNLLKRLDNYGLSKIIHNPNPCNQFFSHVAALE